MSFSSVLKKIFIGGLLLAAAPVATKHNEELNLCDRWTTRHLCDGNLGYSREQMPQVEGRVRDAFLSRQLVVSQIRIPADQLTATQNELNGRIVFGMIRSQEDGKFSPCDRNILVVQEGGMNGTVVNHIVDGHHTWASCLYQRGAQLATVFCGYTRGVIETLRAFPGVFRLNLDDSRK